MTTKIVAFQGIAKTYEFTNISDDNLEREVNRMIALYRKGEIRGFNVLKERWP